MHNMKWIGIFLLSIQPPVAYAQVPVVQPSTPQDARAKRERREQAVAKIGSIARNLVETHGEDAVAAIFACSDATALKLAEFQESGELKKLPKPALLLAVIGRPNHGDDVANFAMQHSKELADEKRFTAFLIDPLTYAMSLKSLDDGVAEYEERLEKAQQRRDMILRETLVSRVIGLGLLLVVILAIWRYRNRFRFRQI